MDCLQFENYLNINTSQYQNLNVETLNHMMERYMLTVPLKILVFKIKFLFLLTLKTSLENRPKPSRWILL